MPVIPLFQSSLPVHSLYIGRLARLPSAIAAWQHKRMNWTAPNVTRSDETIAAGERGIDGTVGQ
jgi:hypothetical protein